MLWTIIIYVAVFSIGFVLGFEFCLLGFKGLLAKIKKASSCGD